MKSPTEMEQRWSALRARAEEMRDPNLATVWFMDWFASLGDSAMFLNAEQLSDWILSTDELRRFDALAVADRFRVLSVVPALEQLEGRLRSAQTPHDRFLRIKVLEVLTRLLEYQARNPSR